MAGAGSSAPGRVVVTGAGGFVGRHVCRALAEAKRPFEAWARRDRADAAGTLPLRTLGDLATVPQDVLAAMLEDVDAIVHLAARAHVGELHGPAAEDAFRHDNVASTRRLADAARRAGVARFVFVSSVKVNGEATLPGRPFRPDDPPAPQDAYGRSKRDSEVALAEALDGSTTTPVVLRLPLVYGPGVRGNFAALVDAVRAGRWLPLGAIDNRRHLLGMDNLVAAVCAVLAQPAPLRGVHFVADADSVSTPQLVRAVAQALGVPVPLAYVPVPLLRLAGRLLGRSAAIDRLTRSLEVDTSSLSAATAWRPRGFSISAADVAG